MKLRILATLFALTISGSAFAVDNAHLDCWSLDGTKIKGSVPGDFAEHDITVSRGEATVHLHSDDANTNPRTLENSRLHVIADLQYGVWTMFAETKGGSYGRLKMYALPSTVGFNRLTPWSYKASFDAVADVFFDGLGNSQSQMKCAIEYDGQ